jgi:predicted nucleic acid-binding protein
MSRSFFDTSVLLYLFDNSVPEKKERAQDAYLTRKSTGCSKRSLFVQTKYRGVCGNSKFD